jgi:hypothetical protein
VEGLGRVRPYQRSRFECMLNCLRLYSDLGGPAVLDSEKWPAELLDSLMRLEGRVFRGLVVPSRAMQHPHYCIHVAILNISKLTYFQVPKMRPVLENCSGNGP